MVRLSLGFKATALVLASTLGSVVADLQITSPSSSVWWVAQSQNLIAWTCHDTNITDFTVLVSNTNPMISVAPIAIIAIQQNFDCSIIITQNQANQPAGTGWQVLLANPLNNTDVYATSEPFEIKPLGSLYPSQTTPSAVGTASDSTNTATGTAAAASTGAPKSGAVSVRGGAFVAVMGGVVAAALAWA